MAWQKYESNKSRANIRASISPAGSINLTQGVQEMFRIESGKTDFAQLYFDNEINGIGIELLHARTRDSLKIIFRGPNKRDGFSISAKSFLIHFDRLPTETRIYDIRKQDGMLVIDLDSERKKATTRISISQSDNITLGTHIQYRNTKPIYYQFVAHEKVYVSNWRELYRKIIRELYSRFPHEMRAMFTPQKIEKFNGLISHKSNISRMDLWENLIPECDGYFYTNKSADDIIRSIRILFKHLKLNPDYLKIGLRQ